MAPKKVAILCGCGVATSTVAKIKLEKLLKDNQIEAVIVSGSAPEAGTLTQGADLIIAITPMPRDFGIPVVRGVSLVSGVGEEETFQEIIRALKQS